jgi:hypothetical protein
VRSASRSDHGRDDPDGWPARVGDAQPEALTNWFGIAFLVAAGVAVVSLVTTLLVLKRKDLRVGAAKSAPVPA